MNYLNSEGTNKDVIRAVKDIREGISDTFKPILTSSEYYINKLNEDTREKAQESYNEIKTLIKAYEDYNKKLPDVTKTLDEFKKSLGTFIPLMKGETPKLTDEQKIEVLKNELDKVQDDKGFLNTLKDVINDDNNSPVTKLELARRKLESLDDIEEFDSLRDIIKGKKVKKTNEEKKADIDSKIQELKKVYQNEVLQNYIDQVGKTAKNFVDKVEKAGKIEREREEAYKNSDIVRNFYNNQNNVEFLKTLSQRINFDAGYQRAWKDLRKECNELGKTYEGEEIPKEIRDEVWNSFDKILTQCLLIPTIEKKGINIQDIEAVRKFAQDTFGDFSKNLYKMLIRGNMGEATEEGNLLKDPLFSYKPNKGETLGELLDAPLKNDKDTVKSFLDSESFGKLVSDYKDTIFGEEKNILDRNKISTDEDGEAKKEALENLKRKIKDFWSTIRVPEKEASELLKSLKLGSPKKVNVMAVNNLRNIITDDEDKEETLTNEQIEAMKIEKTDDDECTLKDNNERQNLKSLLREQGLTESQKEKVLNAYRDYGIALCQEAYKGLKNILDNGMSNFQFYENSNDSILTEAKKDLRGSILRVSKTLTSLGLKKDNNNSKKEGDLEDIEPSMKKDVQEARNSVQKEWDKIKAVINEIHDRAIAIKAYRRYYENPKRESDPNLKDFYLNELKNKKEKDYFNEYVENGLPEENNTVDFSVPLPTKNCPTVKAAIDNINKVLKDLKVVPLTVGRTQHR